MSGRYICTQTHTFYVGCPHFTKWIRNKTALSCCTVFVLCNIFYNLQCQTVPWRLTNREHMKRRHIVNWLTALSPFLSILVIRICKQLGSVTQKLSNFSHFNYSETTINAIEWMFSNRYRFLTQNVIIIHQVFVKNLWIFPPTSAYLQSNPCFIQR